MLQIFLPNKGKYKSHTLHVSVNLVSIIEKVTLNPSKADTNIL